MATQWSSASASTPPPAVTTRWVSAGASGAGPEVARTRWVSAGAAGAVAVRLDPIASRTVEPVTTVTITATPAPGSPTPESYVWRRISGASVTLNGSGATRTFLAPAGMPPTGAFVTLGVAGVIGGIPGDEQVFTISTPPCLLWAWERGSKTWAGARMTQLPIGV